MPFEPTDFRVGLDIGICGRSIRIYDIDQYTREFFEVSYKFSILNPIVIYRTWDNHKLMLNLAQKIASRTPANQFLKRKTQSF